MQRLHEEYFASTLQSVEKPTTGGCLVVASRFGQPEIQSTLKFVYGRKRARAKRRRGRRAEGEGEERGYGWREKSGNFPRATIDARYRGMEDGGQE